MPGIEKEKINIPRLAGKLDLAGILRAGIVHAIHGRGQA
jgi:hypothetical protein